MYSLLLFSHSLVRWFVLISLIFSIYKGSVGWLRNKKFSKTDNFFRHLTATISHIQLTFGYFLYFNSPIIKAFGVNFRDGINNSELRFFSVIHPSLMFISIVFITLGSSIAKRKENDTEKFKTMTIYFLIAFLIILIAIPWSFSPFANRPYFRGF